MTVATMLPYTLLFFGTHEACMCYLRSTSSFANRDQLSNFLAGATAGFLASSLSVPMDVVKTRVQVSEGNVKIIDVCKKLWKAEGLRGFTKGYQSRVMLMTPFAALNFIIFDIVKSLSKI
jgi:hypothetical protein